MKTCVVLPDYGSNLRAWSAKNGTSALSRKACPRPWIAKEIDGVKEFVRGMTDYKTSNLEGTKGVMVRFFCDIGETYLFSQPLPKGGARIFRGVVQEDGSIKETAWS